MADLRPRLSSEVDSKLIELLIEPADPKDERTKLIERILADFETEFGYPLKFVAPKDGVVEGKRGIVDFKKGDIGLYTEFAKKHAVIDPERTPMIYPLFKEDEDANTFFSNERYLDVKLERLVAGQFKYVISFATAGENFGGQEVRELVDAMNKPTVKTYMDSNELPKRPGSYLIQASANSGYPRNKFWQESYKEAMEMASTMVFLITPAWIASPNCMQELFWALSKPMDRKHVIVHFEKDIMQAFYDEANIFLLAEVKQAEANTKNAAGEKAIKDAKIEEEKAKDAMAKLGQNGKESKGTGFIENVYHIPNPNSQLIIETITQAEMASIDVDLGRTFQGQSNSSLIKRVAILEDQVACMMTLLEQQMGCNINEMTIQKSNDDDLKKYWC